MEIMELQFQLVQI